MTAHTPCIAPNKNYLLIDSETGEAVPMGCNTWCKCKGCAEVKARRIANAILISAPSHTFTLTQVPLEYRDRLKMMTNLRRVLKKATPVYMAWVTEENPNGTGLHIQGYAHTGPGNRRFPGRAFIEAAHRVGAQRTDVRPCAGRSVSYYSYLFKEIVDDYEGFLDRNGLPGARHLIHATKTGFWRDGRDGPAIPRVRAERVAAEGWKARQRAAGHRQPYRKYFLPK